jgi:glycosyltransferase involved in cell wall biosynthesis
VIRVLIDGQVFSIHKRGGIGRVFTSLYHEFLQLPQEKKNNLNLKLGVFLAIYSDMPRIRKAGPPYLVEGFLTSSKIALLANWLYLWLLPYKIVHSTYYFQKYLIRRPGTRHVVTLHDMIPEDFPHFFPNFNPHFQKEKFLRNADRIVCVSNYTKSRLESYYPDLVHKAVVISPGVKPVTTKFLDGVRDSNVLYVGKRGEYKDFTTLLRSLPPLIESEPKLKVLAVGTDEFNASELAMIEELGLVGKVIQRELSDQELEEAYKSCLAVVVTSHVEGFGLPVIEAMAHGALVIATDIPVFNEIARGAFLSFTPSDFAELTRVIQKVLENPKGFDSNRQLGYLIATKYSWTTSINDLIALYREIGDSPK